MLEAGERNLLLDSLRPPDGHRFDQGIGTTYSLDLLALLMAPLAFTFFDQSPREEGAAYDSLEVLESLRRYSDKLTLFCEAGRTSIPRAQYPQLAFIEQSVVECAKTEGAFHPKLWVLRFIRNGSVKYRVLCLSRNLVFAQSWDTILTLDGELQDRARAVAASRPLAEFVAALPSFAVRQPAAVEVVARAAALAAELQLTRFNPPEGFDELVFWPIGLPQRRSRSPFRDIGKRLLIVSPFLTCSKIEEIAEETTDTVLVSTAAELGKLTRRPRNVQKFYVLNERVQAEAEPSTEAHAVSLAEAVQLRDLHAKLYVTEVGATAHVWTGSANATAAAFDRNVEFMVELIGPRRRVGLDMLLEPEKSAVRFINLLTPANELVAKTPENPDVVALENTIEQFRAHLAGARLEAHVEGAGTSYDIKVWLPEGCSLEIPAGLTVRCWPSMVARESGVPVTTGSGGCAVAAFQKLTRQALTSFFAFEISGRLNAAAMTVAFVLNLPLVGAPEGRKEDVLRTLLQDRRRLMRFLMLLLAGEGTPVPGGGDDGTSDGGGSDRGAGFSANGLFEMLLRALDEAPHRLDHLESLLAQLRQGRDGDAPLPEGFDAIWEPILAHRRATSPGGEA
ncbi:MAG TPA: phospholipase D family protein [Vicinamibacterales bacterium]|nr:phospholipase D family protein [Vicinamibacterales bacterium]